MGCGGRQLAKVLLMWGVEECHKLAGFCLMLFLYAVVPVQAGIHAVMLHFAR